MKKHTNQIIVFVSLFCYALLFIFNTAIRNGVTAGIRICTEDLIPSLFPSLFISAFITRLGLPKAARRVFSFPVRLMTGLDKNTAESFLFGATGGYPVGVKTAKKLFENNAVSLRDAQAASLINVNPGIAFSLLVAGKLYAGAIKTGVLLWCAVTAANLLIAFSLRFLRTDHPTVPSSVKYKQNIIATDAFIESATDSAKNLFSICLWIVLFTSFASPLQRFRSAELFVPILEVTNAVKYYIANDRLILCAFSMGFGGLCIFMQLLPDLRILQISPIKYLIFRFFVGILSAFFTFLGMKMLPVVASALQTAQPVIMYSSSGVMGSVSLLFFCAVFLLSSVKITISGKS